LIGTTTLRRRPMIVNCAVFDPWCQRERTSEPFFNGPGVLAIDELGVSPHASRRRRSPVPNHHETASVRLRDLDLSTAELRREETSSQTPPLQPPCGIACCTKVSYSTSTVGPAEIVRRVVYPCPLDRSGVGTMTTVLSSVVNATLAHGEPESCGWRVTVQSSRPCACRISRIFSSASATG